MLSLMQTLKRLTASIRASAAETALPEQGVSEPPTPPDEPSFGRSEWMEPAIWGALQIRGPISAGAFGTVYLAWDPALEREVALKLYSTATGTRPGSKVVEEARLLAHVKHDHIAAVYGAGVHDGCAGLWMELVRGSSLEEVVAGHGNMSAREAALAVFDVCHALAAVHAAGLLHRDIKAENVMREAGGRIVLIDFGLGEERRADAATVGRIAGTPLYMAPELLTGARASEASEIYAVGVLLFHLVSGRHPVEAATLDELRQAHAEGHRVLLREIRPDLPVRFVDLVERALAADPKKRYRSIAAVLPELQAVIGAGRAPRSRRERRAVLRVSVAAGTLAALAGGAGWWITRPQAGPRPIVWITDTIAPAGQPDYAGLTVALREQIAQSGMLRTFDAAQVPFLLERMTLPHNVRLSGKQRRELAQRGGVSYIVDSTVVQVGAELRLKVAVESLGPLTLVAAATAEREFPFDDPSRLSAAVQKAGQWVRMVGREPAADVAIADSPPTEVTTDNLQALAHFARGEHFAATGDPLQALAEWKAAVTLDPDFLQAHMRLGDVLRANSREMESMEEYAAAYHLLDRRKLSLRESFRIRSAFLYDTGDMLGADVIHAEWAARFPADSEPLMKRGRPLLNSGRPREAIAVLRKAQELKPQSPAIAWLLALCDITLGDWPAEKEQTSRLRQLQWTDRADLLDADVLFLQGRGKEALTGMLGVRYRNRLDPGHAEARILAVLQAAALYADLGRISSAIELLETDLSPAETMGSPADLAREYLSLARLRLDNGDRDAARAAANRALDLESGPLFVRTAGPLLVDAGGERDALRRLAEFEQKVRTPEAREWRVSRIPRLLVEGEILERRGQTRAARTRFENAAQLDAPGTPHSALARALEADKDLSAALQQQLQIAELYPRIWASPEYYPPGIGRTAVVRATELCKSAGNPAGTEARCDQARQRFDRLRSTSVPNPN
jgi:serine/threonine-protein kinase